MTTLGLGMLGALGGIGVLLVLAGVRGIDLLARRSAGDRSIGLTVDQLALRLVLAATGFLIVGWLSGWLVAGLVAALAAGSAPTAWRSRGRHQRDVELVEAIAAWVEQLRDTLSAASGLEQALVASARVAPGPIAPAVERLAVRLDFERPANALRRFADDLDHPLADFVVAALVVAVEHEAREVASLLGQLAETARDEVRLRQRVWVSRARTRTVVRVIGGVLVTIVGGLMVLDRDYLSPYDSAGGQLALGVIAVVFAASLLGMDRLGRIELPDRFVAAREVA
ncbi:MAG: type II secretion system F family protein [Ilumatobacteraceae bacterium]